MTVRRSNDGATGQHLVTAYRTLISGSLFLSFSLRARAIGTGDAGDALPGAGGARVVGNGLRELDRFLCLLLDEAMYEVAPAGFDHEAFSRRRNAAAKFAILGAVIATAAWDDDRLRAIGRVAACLHHCRGMVHDPARYRDVQIAAAVTEDEVRCGSRLAIPFDQLARICDHYRDTATGLMAVLGRDYPVP